MEILSLTWSGLLSLIACVVLLSCFRSLVSCIKRHRRAALLGCKPPPSYPHRDGCLGVGYLFSSIRANRAHEYLRCEQKLHMQYGNTYTSYFMGKPTIHTIEPDNVRTLLLSNFEDYSINIWRKYAFKPLLGDSIFQHDGCHWAASRELLRPCFNQTQTSGLAMFESHILSLISSLPVDGSTFDLGTLLHRLTTDIGTEYLFGESAGALKNPAVLDSGFLKALRNCLSVCRLRLLLGRLSLLFSRSDFLKNLNITHDYIQKYVDIALETRNETSSLSSSETKTKAIFLEQLGKQTRDRKLLQDEILTLYLAGTDTSAATLTSLIHSISKKRDIWERLRCEVQSLRGRPPDDQQLKNLPYVKACVRESLRLHPPVPINSKVAVRDTVLPTGGGPDGKSPVFVPQGCVVRFGTYSMHRRHDLWGDDAEEFSPERWDHQRPSWKWIPFLKGPRSCLGMNFAIAQVSYILVRLVQSIRVLESRDPQDWTEDLRLACMSKNGALVGIRLEGQ